MNNVDQYSINNFVNQNIDIFHKTRLKCLSDLELKKLLSKNPYLFKAKNINKAGDLIESLLDAFLSSSEEKIFGDFLESLAIFIANTTSGGFKSGISGLDLEIVRDNTHYLISIKSGTNWGNAAQHKKLKQDFEIAMKRIKQIDKSCNIQAILGICYGKTKTSFINGYWKLVGQNFWYFISEDKNLYKEIIEPIGFKAKEHNDNFNQGKAEIINRFTKSFIEIFCSETGKIDWEKLVEFNSGNLDLESINLK
jgi:hypothetical protein